MRARFLLLTLALAACGGKPRPEGPPPPSDDSPTAKAVRAGVEPLYEQEILHGGMVIAVIEPEKDPVYLGFGATPPGNDAIFEIGSVSKVLTGLLLADAVARGEVTLDTPVAQLLPFGVRFPDADGVRPSLGDLVTHRSGLPVLPENLLATTAADPYAGYSEMHLYEYLEFAQLRTLPGTVYVYSNLGAGILGFVLAREIGTTYEQAVKTRVLSPLGLAETFIEVPAALASRVQAGTTAGGDPAGPWSFDVLAGAGAWRSTPKDMVALVQAAAAAAAGKEAPLAEVIRSTLVPMGDAGDGMSIALAWHVTDQGVVWHNGMTGGFASFIGFDQATGRGVVVLASSASPLITKIGMEVFEVFGGAPLDLELGIVQVPEKDLEALVGRYILVDGTELGIVRTGDALYIVLDSEKVRLYPKSATEYLVLELGTTVDFVIDDGVVRGFLLHLPGGDVSAVRADGDDE